MIECKEFLRIPGPTPVQQTVMNAMNTPMIYHRSELFGKIVKSIINCGYCKLIRWNRCRYGESGN